MHTEYVLRTIGHIWGQWSDRPWNSLGMILPLRDDAATTRCRWLVLVLLLWLAWLCAISIHSLTGRWSQTAEEERLHFSLVRCGGYMYLLNWKIFMFSAPFFFCFYFRQQILLFFPSAECICTATLHIYVGRFRLFISDFIDANFVALVARMWA